MKLFWNNGVNNETTDTKYPPVSPMQASIAHPQVLPPSLVITDKIMFRKWVETYAHKIMEAGHLSPQLNVLETPMTL